MRRTSVMAGLTALALGLAACGGGDDAAAPGETATEGAAGSGGGGEVEVFTWWTEGGEAAGLENLVSAFEEANGDLTFVNGAVAGGAGSNARNVLASRLQANDPPDTFQAHAGASLADYIEAGQIQDISAMYDEEGWADAFPQDLIDRLTLDGSIYSVPANIHRSNVVWANPTVLEDAGITDEPTSIDDWIDDLETLRENGVEEPLAVATDWTQVHLLETVLMADLGAEGYTGLWDGSTDWSSEEVTAALEHYGTLLEYSNSDRAGLDWPDAAAYVTDGSAAYTVMGDWTEASYAQQGLEAGTDYTYFPVPGTDGMFGFLADSFVLPVGAPNEEGARAWLRTVGSAEGQEQFNAAKGSIPARTDVDVSGMSEYQQSAAEDFSSDTIVPSLQHGAAATVAWLTDITSAVGQFGSAGDVEQLQEQLVTAAENHAGA